MDSIDDIDLLMLYRGQEIILHPRLGRYILDGVYSRGVFARRNFTGKPEDEEMELFEFDEVFFHLKEINDPRTEGFISAEVTYLRFKARNGYWVGDRSTFEKYCQKPPNREVN